MPLSKKYPPNTEMRQVTDAAGRVLRYRLAKATQGAETAPLLVFFHGWNSAENYDGSWAVDPAWHVLAPMDRFGLNRQGCWWLGEKGDYFMFGLIRQMVEATMAELGGGERPLFVSGNSMGGFGAIIHGTSLKARAVYANVPQVRLQGTQYYEIGQGNFDLVFGDDRLSRHADATNFINFANPEDNPVFFIGHSRHDIYRHYYREHFLYLVERMTQADCAYALTVIPTRGHHNVVEPAGVFEVFNRWRHAIDFPVAFTGERPARQPAPPAVHDQNDFTFGPEGKCVDAGQVVRPALAGLLVPEARVAAAAAGCAPAPETLRETMRRERGTLDFLLDRLAIPRLRCAVEWDASSTLWAPGVQARYPQADVFVCDPSLERLDGVRAVMAEDDAGSRRIFLSADADATCFRVGVCDLLVGRPAFEAPVPVGRQLTTVLRLVEAGGHAAFLVGLAAAHLALGEAVGRILAGGEVDPELAVCLQQVGAITPARAAPRSRLRRVAEALGLASPPAADASAAPPLRVLARAVLDRSAAAAGMAPPLLMPLAETKRPLHDHLERMLAAKGWTADRLPRRAWAEVDAVHERHAGMEALPDLMFAGFAVFRR